MRRILLYLIVAMIMFIVGVTVNTTVGIFRGSTAEEPRPVLTELRSGFPDIDYRGPNHCGYLVISITNDGALYLNSAKMGSLKNTDQLKAKLAQIFAARTENRVYRQSSDISLEVFGNWQIEKTVFIEAPPTMSYGDVTDLIKVVREAGADPIGLVSH